MINKVPDFDKDAPLERMGAEIIAYAFRVPLDAVQRAIDEMKQKQEVKDIINKYKQCQNEET